ncbi:MAG: hypothetical protein ACMG6H_05370, partial [Acidobacteriota bacterium]
MFALRAQADRISAFRTDWILTRMTCKRTLFVIVLCCLVVFSLAEVGMGQGPSKAPKPRRVKIYFYHEPGEYIDLSPVTRVLKSAAPARAAIQALLAGPTAEEQKRGFDGLASAGEFRIGSLTIRHGVARINFVASPAWAGFPGDIAPARFKKAVELTLAQFPNV